MREHVSQKKTTTGFSIPSLKHPTRGFGLESLAISRQAVPEVQPLHKPVTHDISRIPLRSAQAKLSISQPGDKYEQEADSVAQQVMQRMTQPVNRQSIQREALPEDEEELQMKPLDISTLQRQEVPEDEEELQMKSLDNSTLQRQEMPEDEEELQMKPMVQRRADARMADAPDLEASINQARGGGQAMAENIRHPMEQAFGADFSGVKVHTDGQSDQLNRSIQARAFTTGQDVFFRQGEYNPGSRGGQELLAHELTHVVQQNGGAVQRSPLPPQQLSQYPAIETLSTSRGDRMIQSYMRVKVEPTQHLQHEQLYPLAADMGVQQARKVGVNPLSPSSCASAPIIQRAIYTWDGTQWTSDGGSSSSNAPSPKPSGDFVGQTFNDNTKKYSINKEKLEEIAGYSLTFPPPSPDRAYSDSEPDDLDPDFKEGIKNKTKKQRKSGQPRVDNYLRSSTDGTPQIPPDLHADATAIHDLIPKTRSTGKKAGKANNDYGATTIVTALFMQKSTKKVKKFAFSNLPSMPPDLQSKAEELGYQVITAGHSHSEGELLQYLKVARNDYEFLSIGCDKPHCVECQWAMNECLGENNWHTQSSSDPENAALFKQWYMPHALREALNGAEISGPAEDRDESPSRHINNTKKKRKIDEFEKKEKKRKIG